MTLQRCQHYLIRYVNIVYKFHIDDALMSKRSTFSCWLYLLCGVRIAHSAIYFHVQKRWKKDNLIPQIPSCIHTYIHICPKFPNCEYISYTICTSSGKIKQRQNGVGFRCYLHLVERKSNERADEWTGIHKPKSLSS